MANYKEARVKLINKYTTKQIKICSENKTRTTLRITKKYFQDKELSHELIFTKKQKTKIRNVFINNTWVDRKLR